MNPRHRSLQFRLAASIVALFAAATMVVLATVFVQSWRAARAFETQELDRLADNIARHLVVNSGRDVRLALPPGLESRFSEAGDGLAFAVRTPDGAIIAASPAAFGALVKDWPRASDEASFFSVTDFGPKHRDYEGLSVAVNTGAGPVDVTVAQTGGGDEFVHLILEEFVFDVAWIIPLVMAATVGVAVVGIRRGLAPLRRVSALASRIGPETRDIRLPEAGLPTELHPLVAAVNQALVRLENGIEVQRRFTANAAHELRTPLAILTVQLDQIDDDERIADIRNEIARMNRLVEQLLKVARLEEWTLDVSGTVDLAEVAKDAVEQLAPYAIRQKRQIVLSGAERAVRIRGNRDAVFDALYNLIENAIAHTPEGTEVAVRVHSNGRLSVADKGSGIPREAREKIFERFWRGDARPGTGAGLGLAIVREIALAHGGSVDVADTIDGGGAIFTLDLSGRAEVMPPL